MLSRLSYVRLWATLRTAAHQAPPSTGFSRQAYWNGPPFPSPEEEKLNPVLWCEGVILSLLCCSSAIWDSSASHHFDHHPPVCLSSSNSLGFREAGMEGWGERWLRPEASPALCGEQEACLHLLCRNRQKLSKDVVSRSRSEAPWHSETMVSGVCAFQCLLPTVLGTEWAGWPPHHRVTGAGLLPNCSVVTISRSTSTRPTSWFLVLQH